MENAVAAGYEQLGSYLLIRPLGKGGMGVVYLARTDRDDRPLAALKRLRPDCARIPSFPERFKHEGELALRLAHPNIVETLDVGEVDRVSYVASELVLGKDAGMISDRAVERDRPVPQEIAVRILLDALHGLAYVHNAREKDGTWLKLVHRDITPGNLLIGYDGVTRIADFGLASSALTENLHLTQQGAIMGTPKYLAPEVVMGQRAGQGADLYGLGAILYRLLSGSPPYEGSAAEIVEQIAHRPPVPLGEVRRDLSTRLLQLIELMMARDVHARASSAAALVEDLESRRLGIRAASPRELGAYLVELFAAQHEREVREAEEIKAIDPRGHAGKPPSTRVLRLVTKERFSSAKPTDRAPIPVITAPSSPAELPTLDPTVISSERRRSGTAAMPAPELLATRVNREYAIPARHSATESLDPPAQPSPAVRIEPVRPFDQPAARAEPFRPFDQPAARAEPVRPFDQPAARAELVRAESARVEPVATPLPAMPMVTPIETARVELTPRPVGADAPQSRSSRLLAIILATVAVCIGVYVVSGWIGQPDPREWVLVERLGHARQKIARLESQGVVFSAEVPKNIAAATQAIDDARFEAAQRLVVDLEVEVAGKEGGVKEPER